MLCTNLNQWEQQVEVATRTGSNNNGRHDDNKCTVGTTTRGGWMWRAGNNNECGGAATMSMAAMHRWQQWGWVAMTRVGVMMRVVTTRAGRHDDEGGWRRWWCGDDEGRQWAGHGYNICIYIIWLSWLFIFFICHLVDLSYLVVQNENQTCGKLDIACFACRLSTFWACTSLYKHPQENCGNTDVELAIWETITHIFHYIKASNTFWSVSLKAVWYYFKVTPCVVHGDGTEPLY